MGTWATEEMVGVQRLVICHLPISLGRIHGTRGGPCPLDPIGPFQFKESLLAQIIILISATGKSRNYLLD